MLNTTMKLIIAFLGPFVTALLPLQEGLIILLILIIINYISQVVITYMKDESYKYILFKLIKAIFCKKALETLLKRLYEYSFAILMVGLLEVYILGFTPIEIADKKFSLLHFTLVVSGCLEVTRGFGLAEKITGSNMLETLRSFLPERVSRLFDKNPNQNNS